MGFYLSTVGRIPRYQWWLGSLGLVLYAVVAGFAMAATVSHEFGESGAGTITVVIFQLIAVYPYYCITVKRFHDRGKADIFAQLVVAVRLTKIVFDLLGVSGSPAQPNLIDHVFWALYVVIAIWLITELGCLRGTRGVNRYGPDPIADPIATA